MARTSGRDVGSGRSDDSHVFRRDRIASASLFRTGRVADFFCSFFLHKVPEGFTIASVMLAAAEPQ